MRTRVLIAAAGVALVVAGCSSGGGGNAAGGGGGASTPTGAAGGGIVQVQMVGGFTDALTDAQGRVLYVSDQESGGQVLCSTSDCTAPQ